MGLSCTLIYTSELILRFTICVPSATRHNIQVLILIGWEGQVALLSRQVTERSKDNDDAFWDIFRYYSVARTKS